MISVRNVHRFFGDKHVLNDVSFDIRPGLMTGFVGGNGAGKTTTMRIILGVLAANEGQVLVDGQPMNADQRATIGYMPEERGLYPKMKIIDQLVYLAQLHGSDAAEARRYGLELLERHKSHILIIFNKGLCFFFSSFMYKHKKYKKN